MRTWLFVPGHDAHKVQKAFSSSADVVIIDWEDAVPAARKAEARSNAAQFARSSGRPRCFVRINSVQSPYFADDMAALLGILIGGVMLPKVASPEEVQELAAHLDRPIVPLVESAIGVENALAIGRAHVLVERLGFGALDFMADLGVEWSADNYAYQHARTRVAIASQAAGLGGAIDGVYPLLQDHDGLRRDSASARAVGYAGKMLLHPAQIETVREVFSPTDSEIRRAREIVEAFRDAQKRGESAVRLGEAFIDPPVVLWAQHLLEVSEK